MVLSVKNLTVELDGHKIIEDINFSLDKDENLAIIGPNGSGKTILLKALLGLVPYSGKINWTRNTRIGYVPQKIEADRHMPLNVMNLLKARASLLKAGKKEIAEALASVGLPESSLKTPIGHLSGGQFQRALIAFALIGKPSVILFDEPTASIDQHGEEQIYELLHRLQDEHGVASIVVSHDLSFVYRYASTVLCLNKMGICFGAPKEVLNAETLSKLYGSTYGLYHHIHNHDQE